MRKLCRKVNIDGIEPMDADTLEVARVGGWRIVVKKGDFKQGDVALYFEVDSALNPHDDRYQFLRERCYKQFMFNGKLWDECFRIRTMKLRGVVSQGLLMPVDLFCEVRNVPVGEDCSALLAVRHYDDVAEKVLRMTGQLKAADQKGAFPMFIPKTDEERIQNIEQAVIDKMADIPLEVTEKLDGSSMTVFCAQLTRPDDPLGICSRNFELKPGMGSWWEPVKRLQVFDKLKAYCEANNCELALQGELTGPGVNSNRDLRDFLDWSIFRIWNIGEQCWLGWDDRQAVCKALGIPHVPVIAIRRMSEFDCDRDKMLAYAEGKTSNGNEREGLVWKSMCGMFSFKTVSNKYLLKLKE